MNANPTAAINLAAKPTPLERAESAYEQAKLTGDWQTAAELLFKVRKKPRKVGLRKGKCRYPFPIGVATFADGRVATMGFFTPEGKPIDWARAARNCEAAYRNWSASETMKAARLPTERYYCYRPTGYREAFTAAHKAVAVPPIVALYEETTGEVCAIEPQQQAA
ncbi:MAG: hypothetical protein IH905_15020 [Proteobacteria bacterium]|nr:hypothetical protein [Pseudomonadota bacterium]